MSVQSRELGFTLVELLVAIVLAGLVLAGGYTVFQGSNRATVQQNQDSRLQDNARVAMDVLARNFRRAGFLVNYMNIAVGATVDIPSSKILITNQTAAADNITIVGGTLVALGTLQLPAARGSNTIVLDSVSGIAVGSVIGIGYTYSGRVSGVNAGTRTVTLDTTQPTGFLNMNYPAAVLADGATASNQTAAQVRLLSATTYSINWGTGAASNCGSATHPVLQTTVGATCEPIAEDIEDMQFAYGVDVNNNRIIADDEWLNAPTASQIDQIRLVRITVVARTAQPDPDLVNVSQTIPAIEDRPQRVVTDGFRRYILTRIVKTRQLDAINGL